MFTYPVTDLLSDAAVGIGLNVSICVAPPFKNKNITALLSLSNSVEKPTLFNDKKIPINSHSNSFYDLKDLYTSDIDELDKQYLE